MRYARRFGGFALALGLLMVAPESVAAQEMPPAQEQIEVTDELLDRFAAVYPEVVEVAQEAQLELSVVESPEDAQVIQQAAQERIGVILEEGDVSVMEYEAVVARVNDDPAMMAELEAKLAEREADDGGSL